MFDIIYPPKISKAKKTYDCDASSCLKKAFEAGLTKEWPYDDQLALDRIRQDDWRVQPGIKYMRYTTMSQTRYLDPNSKSRLDAYDLCERHNVEPTHRWEIVTQF